MHLAVDLAKRTFHLGVAGMADEDERAPLLDVAAALDVDLADQRAGRIDHRQAALFGIHLHRAADTVRGEDGDGAGGNFVQLLDEHRALRLQRVDDMPVMDDLMADIDGSPNPIECLIDDIDGANDASTETTGLGEKHLDHQYLQRGCHHIVVLPRLRKMAART